MVTPPQATALRAENDAIIGHLFLYPLRVAVPKRGVPCAKVNVVPNGIPSATVCPPGTESGDSRAQANNRGRVRPARQGARNTPRPQRFLCSETRVNRPNGTSA